MVIYESEMLGFHTLRLAGSVWLHDWHWLIQTELNSFVLANTFDTAMHACPFVQMVTT